MFHFVLTLAQNRAQYSPSSSTFFPFRMALVIQGPLCFPVDFRSFSNFLRKVPGVLIGIIQNQLAVVATTAIFIIFTLPNYDHGKSFHLLVSPWDSLVSKFLLYRSLPPWLGWFLDVFRMIVNVVVVGFYWFLSLKVHYWHIETWECFCSDFVSCYFAESVYQV